MRPADYGVMGALLEGAQAETGWDDTSCWVVLLAFLEEERQKDRLIRERFASFLDGRVAEESGETIEEDEECEEVDNGDPGLGGGASYMDCDYPD